MAELEDVGCPNCGASDCWQAIETVEATSRLNFVTLDAAGNLQIEYGGSTEYHDSTCIGLQCFACEWEVRGDDAAWLAELFPKPDLEALLALRDRLAPK